MDEKHLERIETNEKLIEMIGYYKFGGRWTEKAQKAVKSGTSSLRGSMETVPNESLHLGPTKMSPLLGAQKPPK